MPFRGLLVPKAGTWLEASSGAGARCSPRASAIWVRRRSGSSRSTTSAAIASCTWRETTRCSSPTSGDSDHLKIEEISPPTAVRRQSRVRAGGEVVALTLLPSQDVATQSLRVQYHYFTGRINWRPIVISAVILLVTNFAGVPHCSAWT